MKKKCLVTIGLTGLLGMNYGVKAVEADAIDSNAVIEFVKSLEEEDVEVPGITDPETIDPEDPDNPKPNPNPDNNLLRINYVSDFDFGKWGSTGNKITAYAKSQPIKLINGTIQEVAPFISTIDNRGTERGDGWKLEATASELTDNANNVLKGAEIIISNGYYTDSLNAPTVSVGELNISQGTQILATTTVTTGAGQWSMSLGNLREFTTQLPMDTDSSILEEVTYNVTDGVRIEIPKNTITNNTEYTGTIYWDLVSSL